MSGFYLSVKKMSMLKIVKGEKCQEKISQADKIVIL